ncbi:retroviral-like aspartic protease family protein [Altererythrobacter sp. KTW20L]|uniref:retropepsin-like aspartic protease family protein n=1 Tax=Altererythrobacter sp. KTW20L TaxID=2942210 RepID=UPI0020C0E212|nr:retropepsin-like aspartic protease [Altererythrobacter sp. KTW20L]MCL6250466.1 retroviral-like aspartic protease family protein [Altererythrobacter sp. KTW20L]
MPLSIEHEWQQVALYAVAAAVLLIVLFNLPFVGRAFRALFSVGLLALGLFFLFQHAQFDPTMSRLAGGLGLDRQQVVGDEVRIPMSRDGHFWAMARINGVERRMLVDSGATVTALSQQTADEAQVAAGTTLVPVILQTANGAVRAETGTVDNLTLGGIEARDLNVVISPALGGFDVLGMNFLSQLDSWRVERGTLILVPQPREENPADDG